MNNAGIAIVAALGLGFSGVVGLDVAVAKSNVTKVCKHHTHEASGENRIYDRAFAGALQNWKDIVVAHDGPIWAKIDRGAPVHCENISKNNLDWWHCTVIYRPCKLVPLDLPDSLPAPVPSPGTRANP
ncbi:MAG: hypothetical protein GY717_02425 [Rhodobacteraceae bacterium]|nr:hypothetical protein [Paracoccaceae bacterium]